MNSAFVLSAYFAMVLSPCFVAQWGDLLSFKWVFGLVARRRTHSAENLLTSFRHVRYAMAVAAEAAFAARGREEFNIPKPFLVTKFAPVAQTPEFMEARQRVATRLAQLAVAQKLRAAAEAEKAAEMPVVARETAIPVPAAAGSSTHIRPRKPDTSVVYEPVFREPAYVPAPAYAYAEMAGAAAFREQGSPPPLYEVERSPRRGIHLQERPVVKEISGAVEIAA